MKDNFKIISLTDKVSRHHLMGGVDLLVHFTKEQKYLEFWLGETVDSMFMKEDLQTIHSMDEEYWDRLVELTLVILWMAINKEQDRCTAQMAVCCIEGIGSMIIPWVNEVQDNDLCLY